MQFLRLVEMLHRPGRMSPGLRSIVPLIRSCSWCGSWIRVSDFLCGSCWQVAKAKMLPPGQISRAENFPVFALWNWGDKNSAFMGQIIYALKKSADSQLFRIAAQHLVASRLLFPAELDSIILVPAPPSNFGEYDHADSFACAVGNVLTAPVQRLLRRREGGSQKKRGLKSRQQITLDLVDPTFTPARGVSYIFIDDVMTSGATARAARRTLKNPVKFEAWVVSDRLRLL